MVAVLNNDPGLVPLPPFTTINVINRVALTVQPSRGPEPYYISVADPSRVKAEKLVQGGQLSLSGSAAGCGYGGQVTIGMPADRLASYTSSGDTESFVAPGFTPSSLHVHLSGNANLTVKGASVRNQLSANTNGIARLVVSGDLPSADIRTTGSTYTFLSGYPGSVNIDTSGSCTLYIDGTQNTFISGGSTGSGRVIYNHGQCTMSGGHWPGAPCPCQKGPVPPPP